MIYKKLSILIFTLFSSLMSNSQNYEELEFKIYDKINNKPIPFVNVYLFNNEVKIDSCLSDFDGKILIIDTNNCEFLLISIDNEKIDYTKKIYFQDLKSKSYSNNSIILELYSLQIGIRKIRFNNLKLIS
jgi:hypothetical protein